MSTDINLHINLSGTGYELNCALVQKDHEHTAIHLAKTFLEEAEEKQVKHNLSEAQYFENLKTFRIPIVLFPILILEKKRQIFASIQ